MPPEPETKNPQPQTLRPSVLIVDDEAVMASSLAKFVRSWGYEPVTAATGAEALELAAARSPFAAVLLDLRLPDLDGVAVLRRLREKDPDVTVVMLSAYGTIGTAVEAVKAGAVDFLPKPVDTARLRQVLARAADESRLRREARDPRAPADPRTAHGDLLGASPAMRRVYQMLDRVAATDVTVLVQGESGTGKELVARAIHTASPRREGRFVALNCAAVPHDLIESEIFGHEKGAFTGAVARKTGLLEQADGGTFFLDEIGESSPSFQAKLLRVLQERQAMRVGGTEPVPVDVRFIAASNRDLAAEAKTGRFREDLYYRIQAVEIALPPLRERREDIPTLAAHFLARMAERMGRAVPELAPEALAALVAARWPGNVRELQHALERALILDADGRIGADDLPTGAGGRTEAAVAESGEKRGEGTSPSVPLREARDAFERNYLESLLRACGGNVSEAARQAGLARAAFHEKLRRHGIEPEDYR